MKRRETNGICRLQCFIILCKYIFKHLYTGIFIESLVTLNPRLHQHLMLSHCILTSHFNLTRARLCVRTQHKPKLITFHTILVERSSPTLSSSLSQAARYSAKLTPFLALFLHLPNHCHIRTQNQNSCFQLQNAQQLEHLMISFCFIHREYNFMF